MTRIQLFGAVAELHEAAASLIAEAASSALTQRGRFLLVLAGGSTPRGVYHCLAARYAKRIEWQRVHLFWGDERCVPPDHPESNFCMAAESLLDHVAVPSLNLHRIEGEQGAEKGAAIYTTELRGFFGAGTPAELGGSHGFDLVLLGIGADGHTASLFPGSPALQAAGWAVAAQAPESAAVRERITLTLPAINSAREVLFLATGADKRDPVAQVLSPTGAGSPLPAGRIRPRGTVRWLLDAAAAPPGTTGAH